MVVTDEHRKLAREWIRSFQIDGMFIYQRDVDSLAQLLADLELKVRQDEAKGWREAPKP